MLRILCFCVLSFALSTYAQDETPLPPPFWRLLFVNLPQFSGNDVLIAQNLLLRSPTTSSAFAVTGRYDFNTAEAVSAFQSKYMSPLRATGLFDSKTAQKLLDTFSRDNYVDSGFDASSMGYLYKIHIPVYSNRSVETLGTLYDSKNNKIMTFHARTHGVRNDGTEASWPDFGNGDFGLNEFSDDGATVTGLIEVDLNSPEPFPDKYGPWPINRLVRGLDGNAKFLVPNIRNGLLIHTGNWTEGSGSSPGWNPKLPMPNSLGCVHIHPSETLRMYEELVKRGIKVNPNPFSSKNYPYQAQGIAVIQRMD